MRLEHSVQPASNDQRAQIVTVFTDQSRRHIDVVARCGVWSSSSSRTMASDSVWLNKVFIIFKTCQKIVWRRVTSLLGSFPSFIFWCFFHVDRMQRQRRIFIGNNWAPTQSSQSNDAIQTRQLAAATKRGWERAWNTTIYMSPKLSKWIERLVSAQWRCCGQCRKDVTTHSHYPII